MYDNENETMQLRNEKMVLSVLGEENIVIYLNN